MTFPSFDTIKMLYGWGALTNGPEWYVTMKVITTDQYKKLTGKDYEPETTKA